MFDDAYADDFPGKIETDQRVDRMPGISRDADDITCQVGIPEQAFALVDHGSRWVAFDLAETIRLREEGSHRRIQFFDGFGACCHHHAHEQAQRQQAEDNDWKFHERLMRGRNGILEKTEASLIQGDYSDIDFCQLPGHTTR